MMASNEATPINEIMKAFRMEMLVSPYGNGHCCRLNPKIYPPEN